MELWMCMHYAIILFDGFVIGLQMGVIGPSLPDLQCLLEIDPRASNYLLLSQGVGCCTLQLVSSLFFTHISPYLIICCCLVFDCLSFFILPVSGNFYIAAAAMFVMGGTTEVGLCGLFHLSHRVWAGNERIVHLVMAISASGAVLGPLLLNPFLHDGVLTTAYSQKHNTAIEALVHIHENMSNTGPVSTLDKHREDLPGELPANTTQSLNEMTSFDSRTGSVRSPSCLDFSTLIEYPYFIMGVMGVPAIILALYFSIRASGHYQGNSYETVVDANTGIANPGKLYFVLMFLLFVCSQGLPVAFSTLLTTFGVTSSLNISLGTMSVMTSFFWFIHFIGRMLTVLLPRGTKQLYILSTCLIGTLLGTLTLAMAEWIGTAVLWAAVSLFGFFTGPLVSTGLTWSGQVIAVTPKITSFYVWATSCGFMVQFLCGSVMYTAGPKGFVYFCAVVTFMMLTLHVSLYAIIRSFKVSL